MALAPLPVQLEPKNKPIEGSPVMVLTTAQFAPLSVLCAINGAPLVEFCPTAIQKPLTEQLALKNVLSAGIPLIDCIAHCAPAFVLCTKRAAPLVLFWPTAIQILPAQLVLLKEPVGKPLIAGTDQLAPPLVLCASSGESVA